MSVGSSPPQSGPMLSPDGKWVWDGQQWQPIAHHESVFPSWQSVAAQPAVAGPVAGPAVMPVPAPIPMAAPTPAVVQPVNPALFYPPAETAAPLWKRGREPKQTGMNNMLYLAAGGVVIVILLVVLNSVFPLWLLLPGPKSPPAPPAPKATPLPALSERSDYARADYFVSTVFPSLQQDLQPALTNVSQQCGRQLTNSCQTALTDAQPLITTTLAGISKVSVPQCIAPLVTKLKTDVTGLGTAIAAGQKAFTDNQGAELAQAMATYTRYGAAYASDLANLNRVKAQCDTGETGP